MSKFSASELDAMARDCRATAAVRAGGIAGILDDIYALIGAGSVGITSLAADVDAACLGGGLCTQNPNTTAGLTFGYNVGRLHNGKALVAIAAGTIALAASNTNYVEVDRAGAVYANTTAFTAGRMPLWVIVTGVSAIATVTMAKPLLALIGLAGVTGDMLSAAAAVKSSEKDLGTVSATASWLIRSPGVAAVLAGARFGNSTAFATSDTDYWTFSLVNKGPAGGGATAMLDASAANTTKTTGGSALTANVARGLVLHGTAGNLVTAANDLLLLTVTKTGAPANLTLADVGLDFSFTA
jgi:hypothetical protein